MDACYAMWLRELKKFFRNRSRIISSLGQPLMYLLILGYGLNDVFKAAGRGDYISFLAPGIVAMAIIFGSFIGGLSVLWDRKFGFLKETFVAPASRFQVILGRALGSATTASIQGAIVLLVAVAFGFRFDFLKVFPEVLCFMIFIGIMFSSIGIFFGSVIEDFQNVQLVTNFILMPLYFLSGSLFPLQSHGTNKFLSVLALFNPLAYGVDGLRGLLGGNSQYGVVIDFFVVFAMSILFVALGATAFSKTKM